MGFLELFIVALMPVLKVLLVTAVGLLLATDRLEILGPSARNHLNNLVFYVFSPALIGSSLAGTITLDSLVTLWFMPVNILLTFIIGSLLGWILVKITRTPVHLRGLVIGCCSAGNLGNMLLVILPALCEESSSPFGDSSECSTYGESYAALSMAILAIYLWSYVYIIMQIYAKKDTKEIDGNDPRVVIDISGETSDVFRESYTEALLAAEESSMAENYSADKMSLLEKVKQWITTATGKINLKMVLAPSTIAAIVGFIIGIVTPIQKIMIGDSAPLRVIYSSADLIGDAAVPAITLIVGANLLEGLRGSGAGVSVIIGIIAVKFIVMPPLGILIVRMANHRGIVGSDALYQFTLMIQYALPPAMNIGTITQLVKQGESENSVIMLWTYVVATLFLTLWSAVFMWLVS